MSEDDTFDALRKWTLEEFDYEINEMFKRHCAKNGEPLIGSPFTSFAKERDQFLRKHGSSYNEWNYDYRAKDTSRLKKE